MGEKISEHLLPRTRAYAEIWLDQKKSPLLMKSRSLVRPTCRVIQNHGSDPAAERYRSARQRHNFVAIAENGKLVGFNLLVGGGFPSSTATRKPMPARRVSLVSAAGAYAGGGRSRRDDSARWGNRTDRKNAKTKYTLERVGLRRLKRKLNVARGSNLNRSAV